MKKSFKYRIYPTPSQITLLNQTLDGCRRLYNHLLGQRKEAWETEKKNLSFFDQCNTFKILKKEQLFLKNIHSQVLQNVAARIDLAFKAFFRRIKSGDKPGYPRFQGKERYNSFTYPQSGFSLLGNIIHLYKIGDIKVKYHRPIEGIIKTCTIRRTPTEKWFISLVCNIDNNPVKKPIKPTIGIDMGLKTFATFSNGKHIKNPRFFRQEEKVLAKAQRKLSKQKKTSKLRTKARKVVARIHERINWKRENFVHQKTRKIVNRFNTICVEDLSINDMKKKSFRSMNKSIGDAAWNNFLSILSFKAEWAGGRVTKVNPAFTSQNCSRCGHRHKLKLSDRVYHCPTCDLELDRDVNAAKNIRALGLQSLGVSIKVVSS